MDIDKLRTLPGTTREEFDHIKEGILALPMSKCEHKEFDALVTVNRLEDVKRFAADVHIRCRACGRSCRFLGLPGGLHPEYPSVSVDRTEARLPITLWEERQD